MATMTVRLPNSLHEWLQQLQEESGMSLNATITTLLDEARRRGWGVSPRAGEVVEQP